MNGTCNLPLVISEEHRASALPSSRKDVVKKTARTDLPYRISLKPLSSIGSIVRVTREGRPGSIQCLVRKVLVTEEADCGAERLIRRQNNRAEIKIKNSMLEPTLVNTQVLPLYLNPSEMGIRSLCLTISGRHHEDLSDHAMSRRIRTEDRDAMTGSYECAR